MARVIEGIDFDALRADEALLVHVVERYVTGGTPLVRRGLRYLAQTRTDEFSSVNVYRDDAGAWRFHRWSTGQNGDVLDVLGWYAGAPDVRAAAAMLNALPPPPERIVHRLSRPEDRPEPPRWTADPGAAEELVAGYEAHPSKLRLWRSYKPLGVDTIARRRLGVGVLPQHQVIDEHGRRRWVHPAGCDHERLIYAVWERGRVVAVRGRHLGCRCDPDRTKWLSAGGSKAALVGLEGLRPGYPRVVAEQPVDAWLSMQAQPGIDAVGSTAGAHFWKPEWSLALAAVPAERTVVWFDHDLSGNCTADHCPACRRAADEWRAKHPGAKRPPPGGPKVAQSLLEAGARPVLLHDWERGARYGDDLGSVVARHLFG